MKEIEIPATRIPVRDEVDVLVVGGGPAGLMAAQAAAITPDGSRSGLKVMLIESRGTLGGNMTQGLPLLGFLGRKGNEVIKGLPLRFVERLRERGQATHHRACPLRGIPSRASSSSPRRAGKPSWPRPSWTAPETAT